MGYDEQLFTRKPPSDLSCVVCLEVMEEPSYLRVCQHCFCRECISTVLASSRACPSCRTACKPGDILPCVPLVRNLINELEVRCENHREGCEHTCALEALQRHLASECRFVRVGCGVVGCQERVLRQDLRQHEAECPSRVVTCRHAGCGRTLPFRLMRAHEDEECEHRAEACAWGCGRLVPVNQQLAHVENDCPKLIVKCEVKGCGFEGERGDGDAWRNHMYEPAHVESLVGTVQSLGASRAGMWRQAEEHSRTLLEHHGRLQCYEALLARVDAQEEEVQQLRNVVNSHDHHGRAQANRLAVHTRASATQQASIEEQARRIDAHRQVARRRRASVSLLGGSLAQAGFSSGSPNEAVWVLDHFSEVRRTRKLVHSPELAFSNVANPALRYSFKLSCFPNGQRREGTLGGVGLFFLPRRGPNHKALEWPMQHRITVAVVSHGEALDRAFALEPAGADAEYFARHCPPRKRLALGRGNPGILSPQLVESGHYTHSDCLVVRVVLEAGEDLARAATQSGSE